MTPAEQDRAYCWWCGKTSAAGAKFSRPQHETPVCDECCVDLEAVDATYPGDQRPSVRKDSLHTADCPECPKYIGKCPRCGRRRPTPNDLTAAREAGREIRKYLRHGWAANGEYFFILNYEADDIILAALSIARTEGRDEGLKEARRLCSETVTRFIQDDDDTGPMVETKVWRSGKDIAVDITERMGKAAPDEYARGREAGLREALKVAQFFAREWPRSTPLGTVISAIAVRLTGKPASDPPPRSPDGPSADISRVAPSGAENRGALDDWNEAEDTRRFDANLETYLDSVQEALGGKEPARDDAVREAGQ